MALEPSNAGTFLVKTDCSYFNGYKPCKPHKQSKVHCDDCATYTPHGPLILIIKLKAAGEVIRNTPLLRRLKKEYPNARIFWLTQYPELVPQEAVFKVLPWNFESVLLVENIEFDLVLSLDKDLEACALANRIHSKKKKGFTQSQGVILPIDADSTRKWKTGVFDDLMKENQHHYVEEIFKICGYSFTEEAYWLPKFDIPKVSLDHRKKIVALNTGAGDLWRPRLYSPTRWKQLAKALLDDGFEVFLTGGPSEHEKNLEIASDSHAKYFGTFKYLEFLGLLSLADIVVTSVSFAFHVAVGLEKKIVLLNNTFNAAEFYMYGRGVVLEPKLPCLMCYKNDFDEQCVTRDCMDLVQPELIQSAVQRALS